MRKQKVTFADIAKETGFSKTTISRYFNAPDTLTTENQEIICRALEKLHYRENKVARILASGHTEFIGFVVPNLYMHYYAEMLHQMLTSYSKYGYKFLVFESYDKEDYERTYLQDLLSYNVEGIIILSHAIPSRELASYGVPVVAIEREDHYISSVNTDNLMGGVQAASLLYKCGCDDLFFIDGPILDLARPHGRRDGFINICTEKGIPFEVLISDIDNSDYKETYNAFSKIVDDIALRYPGKKKGIFCANDTYASMVLTHLVRSYGHFPDDFSLIGFDGSPASENAIIPFSTIGQQINVIAERALEVLNEQIEARNKRIPESVPIRHEVVTPVVINRETTSQSVLAEPASGYKTGGIGRRSKGGKVNSSLLGT